MVMCFNGSSGAMSISLPVAMGVGSTSPLMVVIKSAGEVGEQTVLAVYYVGMTEEDRGMNSIFSPAMPCNASGKGLSTFTLR